MRGVFFIILQVMHLTLLSAAQSVQTVVWKDMLPFIGRNNHLWEPIREISSKELTFTDDIWYDPRIKHYIACSL